MDIQVVVTAVIAISTLLGVVVSGIITYKGQTMTSAIAAEDNRLDHNDALLQAYSKMVDDLQNELDRLKATLAEVRADQEACDKRNLELTDEVKELRLRVHVLESSSQ
jgi:peptidoglycan hydrolase CwlO-like protein